MQARDPTLLAISNHMHSTWLYLCSDHDILCVLTLTSPLVSSCTTSFEARSQNSEKLLLASSRLSIPPSVCLSEWKNSAQNGVMLVKFCIWVFFENLPR